MNDELVGYIMREAMTMTLDKFLKSVLTLLLVYLAMNIGRLLDIVSAIVKGAFSIVARGIRLYGYQQRIRAKTQLKKAENVRLLERCQVTFFVREGELFPSEPLVTRLLNISDTITNGTIPMSVVLGKNCLPVGRKATVNLLARLGKKSNIKIIILKDDESLAQQYVKSLHARRIYNVRFQRQGDDAQLID